MSKWSDLAPDLKICVKIYTEQKAGREVWASRALEILQHDMDRKTFSMNEDRLMDLGILDGSWKKVEGKWTYCYRICNCTASFIKNVADNVTEM